MKKIFVSGLNFRMDDDDLRNVFAEYGEISSAVIIKDNFSGRSRGFGFVEMPSDDDADKAIKELNGAEVDGKVLTVNVARPRTESKPGGSRNYRDNGFRKRY